MVLTCTLTSMPMGPFAVLMSCLKIQDVTRLNVTCSSMRNKIAHDIVWRTIYTKLFPTFDSIYPHPAGMYKTLCLESVQWHPPLAKLEFALLYTRCDGIYTLKWNGMDRTSGTHAMKVYYKQWDSIFSDMNHGDVSTSNLKVVVNLISSRIPQRKYIQFTRTRLVEEDPEDPGKASYLAFLGHCPNTLYSASIVFHRKKYENHLSVGFCFVGSDCVYTHDDPKFNLHVNSAMGSWNKSFY